MLVGRIGRTVTVLNPAGMALIDGSRVHCQSEGMIIPEGTPVRVVSARHNHVTVREHEPSADPASPLRPTHPETVAGETAAAEGGGSADLDFPLG
jgi:hypothetical protein